MELVVWNAARRLAVLVFGALTLLGAAVVYDRRLGLLPGALGGLALALLLISLVPLLRASQFLRAMSLPPKAPPAALVYRANPVGRSLEAVDRAERAVTHQAAVAFLLLALAGALAVVAAAAR